MDELTIGSSWCVWCANSLGFLTCCDWLQVVVACGIKPQGYVGGVWCNIYARSEGSDGVV